MIFLAFDEGRYSVISSLAWASPYYSVRVFREPEGAMFRRSLGTKGLKHWPTLWLRDGRKTYVTSKLRGLSRAEDLSNSTSE